MLFLHLIALHIVMVAAREASAEMQDHRSKLAACCL